MIFSQIFPATNIKENCCCRPFAGSCFALRPYGLVPIRPSCALVIRAVTEAAFAIPLAAKPAIREATCNMQFFLRHLFLNGGRKIRRLSSELVFLRLMDDYAHGRYDMLPILANYPNTLQF